MSKSARILVVDDEIDSVDLLVMMLTAQGFDAVGTTQPREALKKFESEEFALVISDLLMPEVDGWTLLKQLTAIKPDVQVLALTARAITGDKEKVLDAGFVAYLSKPVLMDQLQKTVHAILDRADSKDKADQLGEPGQVDQPARPDPDDPKPASDSAV